MHVIRTGRRPQPATGAPPRVRLSDHLTLGHGSDARDRTQERLDLESPSCRLAFGFVSRFGFCSSFLAHVAHFEPDTSGQTEAEKTHCAAWRWWSLAELEAATDDLAPRDLPARLRAVLRGGPPEIPLKISI